MMDQQGTDVHVIFPPWAWSAFSSIEDPELAGACARAYNRYCADFASADPRRLRPVMMAPSTTGRGREEMRFARERRLDRGLRQPDAAGDAPLERPRP